MEVASTEAVKLLGLTGGDDVCISKWDARSLGAVRRNPAAMIVARAIDELGVRSGLAQGLARPITSAPLLSASDHTLYLIGSQRTVFGLLKVGKKNLFIRDSAGALKEISPLCVLDFYVSEDHQRSGRGKQLFEHMLSQQDATPNKLGYDRPSSKLLGFMRKHYGLDDHVKQNNSYVVYDAYFNPPSSVSAAASADEGAPAPRSPSHYVPRESRGADDPRRLPQRHSSPHRPSQPAYNIITQQQEAAGVGAHAASKTGKRLVRPVWAA